MPTFENIFNHLIWKSDDSFGFSYWKSKPEAERDNICRTVRETLQFLITNRGAEYTFQELSDEMRGRNVLLSYRRKGCGGGISTAFVLGACNSILFYLWNLKEGNKKYEVPPISCIIVNQNCIANSGAGGFIKKYIDTFHNDAEIEEVDDDGFVRDQIRVGFDRWDDVWRILFREQYDITKILKEKINSNERLLDNERKALHSELVERLMNYLKKDEDEMKKEHVIPPKKKGKQIDLYLTKENVIIEVKIANSNWECLRYSVGQLMEYNHLLKKGSKLICVGNHPISKDFKNYIKQNQDITGMVYTWEDKKKKFQCYGSGFNGELLTLIKENS